MPNSSRTSGQLGAMFALVLLGFVAAQQPGEGQFLLNPPTPEPTCDCSSDLYNCEDFATRAEAQRCFDSCWVLTGLDVHQLDADGDYVACESRPDDVLLAERKVAPDGPTRLEARVAD